MCRGCKITTMFTSNNFKYQFGLIVLSIVFVLSSAKVLAQSQNSCLMMLEQIADCESGVEENYQKKIKEEKEWADRFCPGGDVYSKNYSGDQLCEKARKDEIKNINEAARILAEAKANCKKVRAEIQAKCNAPSGGISKPKPSPVNPNGSPPEGFSIPSIDLNRRCPKAEKYFPRNRIESIYGKKVIFMNPGNQETLNKYDSTFQEGNAKLEEAQRRIQQDHLDLRLKNPGVSLPEPPKFSPPDSSYSFKGYPDSKDWETCNVFFIDPTGGSGKVNQSGVFNPSQAVKGAEEMIFTSFVLYNSPDAAEKVFNTQPEPPQNLKGTVIKTIKDVKVSGLGDEGRYIKFISQSTNPSFGNVQVTSYYLSARKGSFLFSVTFYRESDYPKAEELLKKALGSADYSGTDEAVDKEGPNNNDPAEPKKKAACSASSELTVTSYAPKETYAGQAGTRGRSLYDSEGYVLFYPRQEQIELTGKCLEGLTVSSGDLGIDNRSAITFNWTQVSGDGSKAVVSMYVSEYAKEGAAKILLKNKYSKSRDIILKINITGTQYLNRKFAPNNIKFYGHWEEVDDRVKRLESETDKIFGITNAGKYKMLGIFTKIYEESYWQQKGTGIFESMYGYRPPKLLGFSDSDSNIIYITESYDAGASSMPGIALHESIHKLQDCYAGEYPPASSKCKKTSFHEEWWKLAVRGINTCEYLPVVGFGEFWKGGKDKLPRCGFIRPYGAVNLPANWALTVMKALGGFYVLSEDVATIKSHSVYAREDFSRGDAGSGIYKQVYLDKLKLLDKYGF